MKIFFTDEGICRLPKHLTKHFMSANVYERNFSLSFPSHSGLYSTMLHCLCRDTAYTMDGIESHTDGCYFSDAPGMSNRTSEWVLTVSPQCGHAGVQCSGKVCIRPILGLKDTVFSLSCF